MERAMSASEAERRLAELLERCEPRVARLGKSVRKQLRARWPGLHELVYLYENQGALVLSYSPTERGAEGVCALALRPDELHLYLCNLFHVGLKSSIEATDNLLN